MINDLEKFKKQCEEYDDFVNNIEQITKDFCSFFEKENPFDKSEPKFYISNDKINLSWTETTYCCGERDTEYYDMEIPLDFYDKLSEYEILKENIKKEISDLSSELKTLTNKETTLNSSIRTIQSEIWKIEEINKKHSISLDLKELKVKKRNLESELMLLLEPIKNLKKEIKILKEKI